MATCNRCRTMGSDRSPWSPCHHVTARQGPHLLPPILFPPYLAEPSATGGFVLLLTQPLPSLQDLPLGVAWLSQQPVVTWVAPSGKPRTANAYAGVVLQTGAC